MSLGGRKTDYDSRRGRRNQPVCFETFKRKGKTNLGTGEQEKDTFHRLKTPATSEKKKGEEKGGKKK